MNVANLQIEGLIMALACTHRMLVEKGILSVEEIEHALHKAEATLTAEERLFQDMSPANRDAVCFPLRVLRVANRQSNEGQKLDFAELTRIVGETKQSYNDQR